MNQRYHPLTPIYSGGIATGSILAFTVAMAASVSAHAEYRCSPPSTPEDRRACELAKQDASGELRHFIQRTSSIYGLYFYDYVRASDLDRWEAARRDDGALSVAAVDGRTDLAKAHQ